MVEWGNGNGKWLNCTESVNFSSSISSFSLFRNNDVNSFLFVFDCGTFPGNFEYFVTH